MKSITIRILSAVIFVMFFTSCWTSPGYYAQPDACMSIINETDRILVFNQDIFPNQEIEEVEPGRGVHLLFDYEYKGHKINESLGWRFLNSYGEGTYFRVYNADGELLKEWKRSWWGGSKKNPFDVDYYDYKYDEKKDGYSWVFRIDEELLSQEE